MAFVVRLFRNLQSIRILRFNAPMNSLVTIEEYDKAHLAQVAVLAIEEAGIQCFLQNETIVAMDWFISNAVGGIRLQVAAENADAAKRILDEIQESKREREETSKDTWVAFHCERCKKPIAFSGISLGRVESCPKCGKYVDVPNASDSSMSEASIQDTIESEKNASTFLSSGQSQTTYLVCELFLVLCIAYFLEVIHAIITYMRQSISGSVNEYSVEYLVDWWSVRSLYVLLCMTPILLLHRVSTKSVSTKTWSWPKSLAIGVLLGGTCFSIDYVIASFVQERAYEKIIEWPAFTASVSSLYWYSWFALAIIANSVAEELVMRAYLIDRLEKLFGKAWIAVLVSALLFGSYHIYQGLTGLVTATMFGVFFGLHYARYRKLLPLVIGHTLYNLVFYTIYFLYRTYE